MDKKIEKVLNEEPNYKIIRTILTIISIILLFWSSRVMDFSKVSSQGSDVVKSILGGIIHPDMTLLSDFSSGSLWYLIFETICIAFVGTLIGALISLPLAFLSSANIVPRIYVTLRLLV